MILYDKILQKYSKSELNKFIDPRLARKIYYNKGIIPAGKIAKIISFDEIGYCLEDALLDYCLNKKYKEYVLVFELLKRGTNIKATATKFGLSDNFDYMLKKGLNFESKGVNSKKIIDIFNINVDISLFTLDKYDTHIEIFGDRENLIKFKEKYQISKEVIYEPFKNSWHLAFNGMLADWIRENK